VNVALKAQVRELFQMKTVLSRVRQKNYSILMATLLDSSDAEITLDRAVTLQHGGPLEEMESLNEVILRENIKEKQSSTRYTEKKYGSENVKWTLINLIIQIESTKKVEFDMNTIDSALWKVNSLEEWNLSFIKLIPELQENIFYPFLLMKLCQMLWK
jgi:hypothetical protein